MSSCLQSYIATKCNFIFYFFNSFSIIFLFFFHSFFLFVPLSSYLPQSCLPSFLSLFNGCFFSSPTHLQLLLYQKQVNLMYKIQLIKAKLTAKSTKWSFPMRTWCWPSGPFSLHSTVILKMACERDDLSFMAVDPTDPIIQNNYVIHIVTKCYSVSLRVVLLFLFPRVIVLSKSSALFIT